MSDTGAAGVQQGDAGAQTTGPDGFTRTEGFVVRQWIAAGQADAVQDRIEAARPDDDGDAGTLDWLVDDADVTTVSLFLDRRDGVSPALYWYLEVTDEFAWGDPAGTLRERSPLFGDAAGTLDGLLVGEDRVHGGADQVVHAHNPARPETPDSSDVVLVRVGVRPGLGTTLMRLLVGAIHRLEGTRIEREMVASSAEVLEEERMWTETLFLDRGDDGDEILWYMEADDMDHVIDAYERSDNRVARWSEVVLNRLFEQPMDLLGDPMEASGYELLAHATNPAAR